MDSVSSLRRYLNLKNTLIPSIQKQISDIKGKLFRENAELISIKDEKVFLQDFKWQIRTRGFTIFNLMYFPSLLTLFIYLIIATLITTGITIIWVIVETFIRSLLLSQNYDFEDMLIAKAVKIIEDIIYNPPTIPFSVIIIFLVIWLAYSIRQISKNKSYYENVVIPENRKKNALLPTKRRKQQKVVDDLTVALNSSQANLNSYSNEIRKIQNTLPIPQNYFGNDEALLFLLNKLEYGQAKTIPEALNLWERELQTRRAEKAAKDMIRETREAEQRLARQRHEQYLQEQQNKKQTIEALNKIAEERKRENDRNELYDNIARRNGWL